MDFVEFHLDWVLQKLANSSPTEPPFSVIRLGEFRKFLATNFISKVAQILGHFLGYSENHHFERKNVCGYFWENFKGSLNCNIRPHCLRSSLLHLPTYDDHDDDDHDDDDHDDDDDGSGDGVPCSNFHPSLE